MADEVEKEKKPKEVFDSKAASSLINELRQSFGSAKTRSYEWRVSQLESLVNLANDHEQDIVDALRSDVSKPELESVIYEVNILNFCFFLKYFNFCFFFFFRFII